MLGTSLEALSQFKSRRHFDGSACGFSGRSGEIWFGRRNSIAHCADGVHLAGVLHLEIAFLSAAHLNR